MAAKDVEGLGLKCIVRISLIDLLGKAIVGLKYIVQSGPQVVVKGTTDGLGALTPFQSNIGTKLDVFVQRLGRTDMKLVQTVVPWCEIFAIKLVSEKVLNEITLLTHRGDPGSYKRSTYTVQKGDSLSLIARRHSTTADALARLNGLKLTDLIHPGQVLKVPLQPGDASTSRGSRVQPHGDEHRPGAHADSSSRAATRSRTPAPAGADNSSVASAKSGQGQGGGGETAPILSKPLTALITELIQERGENGTPKTKVTAGCGESACIKIGDKGPLIEEINIRLAGFGWSLSPGASLEEFTDQTSAAVKQFQRDFMGVSPTGKVCGTVLKAIDDFLLRYPLKLEKFKCQCQTCDGFGRGRTNSAEFNIINPKTGSPFPNQPRQGVEYPGMHRMLIWAFRASIFYISEKDANLGYALLRISSGYRCWKRNRQLGYITNNHMGNAIDAHFKRGTSTLSVTGANLDKLRDDIFVDRLGAQLGWGNSNMISLERTSDGADKWVHMDVRELSAQYKLTKYYARTQGALDGTPVLELARLEGRFQALNCGGIPVSAQQSTAATVAPQSPKPAASDRLPGKSLRISDKGLMFIKDWEKFSASPYDDTGGACTIGWGHKLADRRCAELAASGSNKEYEKYKTGISRVVADQVFLDDLRRVESRAMAVIQVPLYQHEYDALLSLAFNTGGNLVKFSKLLSKLNTRDYKGCCAEFADITNHGLKGLVRRRVAEMNMFNNNVYDSTH